MCAPEFIQFWSLKTRQQNKNMLNVWKESKQIKKKPTQYKQRQESEPTLDTANGWIDIFLSNIDINHNICQRFEYMVSQQRATKRLVVHKKYIHTQ